MKEDYIWEEKNLTERQKNSENNPISDPNDIINEINKKLTKKQWKDIGTISGIYKILNKNTNKYYVGSSKNIVKRLTNHINDLNRNLHHNDYLQRSWNKDGENIFEFYVIELIEPKKELLLNAEQKYLNNVKSEQYKCYNLNFDAFGGDISEYSKLKIKQKLTGIKRSDFTKKRISESHKGILLGVKLSSNHKLKISNAKKGKSNGRIGTNHSFTTIEKMKRAHNGKKLSSLHKQKISSKHIDKTIHHFYNTKTNIHIYTTQYKLKQIFKLNGGNLTALIKNKRKSCSGWVIHN